MSLSWKMRKRKERGKHQKREEKKIYVSSFWIPPFLNLFPPPANESSSGGGV
jgi:hypothetical protein